MRRRMEQPLLTQDEDKNRFPLFESINREEENIEITYVPFVIGVSIRNWQISASGILRSAVFICRSIREGYILLLI